MAPQQDPDFGTFSKGSITRTAQSPEERVRFIYEGWREVTPDDGPPPRTGRGSGKDAWVAYAAANDVTVADDASRDDIIAALDAAGVDTGPAEPTTNQ